mmetsp:Transcript_50721/g.111004  ORF Transcript_50721/g.111004 Transcript_50721/m.111004 type:complete len:208 (+) Transcript_50721:271-894(+)
MTRSSSTGHRFLHSSGTSHQLALGVSNFRASPGGNKHLPVLTQLLEKGLFSGFPGCRELPKRSDFLGGGLSPRSLLNHGFNAEKLITLGLCEHVGRSRPESIRRHGSSIGLAEGAAHNGNLEHGSYRNMVRRNHLVRKTRAVLKTASLCADQGLHKASQPKMRTAIVQVIEDEPACRLCACGFDNRSEISRGRMVICACQVEAVPTI